jgi:hypothetical protein
VSNTIATQLIRHDLPGFTTMTAQQPFEEALSSSPIPFDLKKYINHFAVLVHSPPKVMLLAVDLHKDFVDVEGIAITTVLPLQSSSVYSSELDTP